MPLKKLKKLIKKQKTTGSRTISGLLNEPVFIWQKRLLIVKNKKSQNYSEKSLTSLSLFCIISIDKKVAKKAIFNYLFLVNMNKLTNYLKESVSEMKKVTWPTKKETYNYTILVIGISLAVAVFLGALDFIFNLGLQFIV